MHNSDSFSNFQERKTQFPFSFFTAPLNFFIFFLLLSLFSLYFIFSFFYFFYCPTLILFTQIFFFLCIAIWLYCLTDSGGSGDTVTGQVVNNSILFCMNYEHVYFLITTFFRLVPNKRNIGLVMIVNEAFIWFGY